KTAHAARAFLEERLLWPGELLAPEFLDNEGCAPFRQRLRHHTIAGAVGAVSEVHPLRRKRCALIAPEGHL
ncbi:MAG: hypothetical protein ACM37Z_07855, partial [Deltaproteobacteria bacterium]